MAGQGHFLRLRRSICCANPGMTRTLTHSRVRTANGWTPTWTPAKGTERGAVLGFRAYLAAANNDRDDIVRQLTALYDTGGLVAAYYAREPMVQPHLADPRVAAADEEVRRASRRVDEAARRRRALSRF